MLVPEETVKRWYMRESWVYKNFAYIYQNPLWNRRIPVGRSVCPYFWSSMWSLLFLRPTIMFIVRVCIPTMKRCGLGIAPLDKWIVNKIFKAFHGEDMTERQRLQTPTGIGVMVCTALLLLLSLAVRIGFKIAHMPSKPVTPVEHWINCLVLAGVTMLAILGLFKFINNLRDKPSDCKVFRYMWLWVAGAVISPFFMIPKQLLWLGTTIVHGVSYGVTVAAVNIWQFLCYCGSGVGHFLGHWVPVLVMGGLHYAWLFISYCPAGFPIPWWLYIIGAAGLFMLMDKLMANYESKQKFEFTQTHTPEEIRASNRRSWTYQIVQCLTTGDEQVFPNRLGRYLEGYELEAAKCRYFRGIIQSAVEVYFKDLLDKLEVNCPNVDPSFWSKHGPNQMASINTKLFLLTKPEQMQYDETGFNGAIHSVLPLFMIDIREVAKDFEAQAKRKIEAKIKRKESASYKYCIAVTERIGDIVESVFSGLGKGFCALGRGIAWCWKMFCTFWKNVWTFICYMFVLLKAKKQKACPYMTFQDTPPPTAPVTQAPVETAS